MKFFPRLALICLLILPALNCHTAPTNRRTAVINVVPSNSLFVMSLNWPEVRSDDDFKSLIKSDGFERVLRQAGIEPEKVNQLAVFGDARKSGDGSSGVIFSGSFNARTIINQLKTQGWGEGVFQGSKIYSKSSGDAYITYLKSQLMVIGTKSGVEGAISAQSDSKKAFVSAKSVKTLITQLNEKQKPVSIFVALPESTQDMSNVIVDLSATVLNLAGVEPLGVLLSKIGIPGAMGCSISKDGENFPLELLILMEDEDASQAVSGILNLIKITAAGIQKNSAGQSEAQKHQSYQSLQVSRERELLSVKIDLTRKDLMQ